jgi:predicted RNase H-like HicB family nuclease
VVGYAPRAREGSMRPRRLMSASGRPLNFTVRDGQGFKRLRAIDTVARYTGSMRNEFTAIIERDGKWFVAYSPEVPGANGQGRTKAEARKNLASAIALILRDRRMDALRGLPRGATRETVTVE